MVPSKITERVKLDLHMLRLRNAIDPSQHYKKFDTKAIPKVFQVFILYRIIFITIGWDNCRRPNGLLFHESYKETP